MLKNQTDKCRSSESGIGDECNNDYINSMMIEAEMFDEDTEPHTPLAGDRSTVSSKITEPTFCYIKVHPHYATQQNATRCSFATQ